MSHISGPCACQEAPHVQAALCQVEQEDRETEYEKEKRERGSAKKKKRDQQSLLALYIDLLTLYVLYEPARAAGGKPKQRCIISGCVLRYEAGNN